MAITTFAELKAAATDWLARDDAASYGDDAVLMAEGYFNRRLRHRKMVTKEDLTPTSGVCSLPDDYLKYRRVVEKAALRRPLEHISDDGADELYPSRVSGPACHFAIIGDTLETYPLATNDIELTYYQEIPALSESNSSNWLLAKAPNLYLRATQVQLLTLINEMESARFVTTLRMAEGMIDELNEEAEMAEYAGAVIRPTAVTP